MNRLKSLFQASIAFVNSLFFLTLPNVKISYAKLYFTKIHCLSGCSVNLSRSNISKSSFNLHGSGNLIKAENAEISDSIITVQGVNNRVIIDEQVKLRKATIVVRGSNCSIYIGAGSTFGQIRIVNVGKNNTVSIGKSCLFADNIELWASDTHSIFDIDGKFINAERPVTIGDNVWIGSYVKILKGVTIGSGAIVGMNTLISKNIAAKTLNVGHPIRCIKEDVTWSLKYENEAY